MNMLVFFMPRPPEKTQLEDPRAQWQREQEFMLRDYLAVARDALSAQKEIYQVKEQRLRLAQQEYLQLNDAWRDKSTSQTSCEYESVLLWPPDAVWGTQESQLEIIQLSVITLHACREEMPMIILMKTFINSGRNVF